MRQITVLRKNGRFYPELLEYDKVRFITTDDRNVACKLTEALIHAGHRSIGGIFISDEAQSVNRFSGYVDGLNEYGFSIMDDYVLWTSVDRKQAIENLLKESKIIRECSAVLCSNDELAFKLSSYINEHPSSISMIYSFDGIQPDVSGEITIHSCRYPKDTIGNLAVEKLIDLIAGQSADNQILPWENVVL